MVTPCIIDCDPGHDDAIALILASALPQLELRGITTVAGNSTVEHTTDNALRVASLAGIDAPVAAGASRPLHGELVPAADIHGTTGLDGVELPGPTVKADRRTAVELIMDVLREATDPVTIIALGPLTNIATLLRDRHVQVGKLREIVFMGGSTEKGNVTPAAEFNIYTDPEAAH